MAQINVKTTVTAPSEVNIPLVRADHHDTSNVFRVFFELCLAFFFCLLGNVLSIEKITTIHYLALGFSGIAAIACFVMTVIYSKKSRCL